MNKRKFFGLLGSAVVGAMLSVGLRPLKKPEVITGEVETEMFTVRYTISYGGVESSLVADMAGETYKVESKLIYKSGDMAAWIAKTL